MRQISQEQINAIIQAFYDVNAPVKLFEGVKKMLTDLPEVKTEVKE